MTARRPPIRLGAVEYLNARPLVYGLDRHPSFALRYDVPSRCADLLHANAIDVGLIPSIEYPGHEYRIVPGVSIASDGPVASVAVFSTRPTDQIRSIAIDTSSRTSVALLRILCARWFEIQPRFVEMSPNLGRMLGECDAAHWHFVSQAEEEPAQRGTVAPWQTVELALVRACYSLGVGVVVDLQ